MAIFRRRTKIFLTLFALLLAAGGALAPLGKSFLENRIKIALESQGFPNVRLSLASIGWHTLKIDRVAWGKASAPLISELTLSYTPLDLLKGRLQALALTKLQLEVAQESGGWNVAGYSPPSPVTPSTPFALPVSEADIDAFIPLSKATIDDSRATLAAKTWQAVLPFQSHWDKEPTPRLTFQADQVQAKSGALALHLATLKAEAALQAPAKLWQGTWTVTDATLSGFDPHLPALNGQGQLTAKADQIAVKGTLQSADAHTKIVFQLAIDLADPRRTSLRLDTASLPWNGGTLSAQRVSIPLGRKAPISGQVNLKGLSLDALLAKLTGNKASATGKVSGTLPITFKPDGTIEVHRGTLAADGPGEIKLAPEAIPGDNAQVALVRDVLKNLHYRLLTIDVESGADGKLTTVLKVQGRNPDLYGGKPVHLNVKLTGDVLAFAQQNLLSLTNPQEFLKRSGHGKP